MHAESGEILASVAARRRQRIIEFLDHADTLR